MDAPFRAHDGLLVVEPHHAALLRLPHDVCDGLVLRKVEVIVGLDAAAVCVGRHRVPYRALLQLSETHLQLTGAFLQHGVDDELIDSAQVALSL